MPSNCSRSLGPAVGSVTTVRVNALPVLQTTRFCTLWISVIVDDRVTPRNEPDEENSLTVPFTRKAVQLARGLEAADDDALDLDDLVSQRARESRALDRVNRRRCLRARFAEEGHGHIERDREAS